jgi:hypothetical protein
MHDMDAGTAGVHVHCTGVGRDRTPNMRAVVQGCVRQHVEPSAIAMFVNSFILNILFKHYQAL